MSAEIINALRDTPIPTILIFAGLFFILLAFVSKVGGVIEVQPTQQKWSAPIGIALLVFGLILALNTPSEPSGSNAGSPTPSVTSTATPQLVGCAALFTEGAVLNWETFNNDGTNVNKGTLRIETIDFEAGTWRGEQMTEPKGAGSRDFLDLSGSFEGAQMTLDNPKHSEIWSGTCSASKIEGVIERNQPAQFMFEMQKQ